MSISTLNLFHYTKKESLKAILQSGFYFGNVAEDLPIIDPDSDDPLLAIPDIKMTYFNWRAICFCDIPIEHITNHRQQYGDYSIGLNKEWAILNRITPVRYVHHYTPYNLKLLQHAIDILKNSTEHEGFASYIVDVFKELGQVPKEYDFNKSINSDKSTKIVIQELEANLFAIVEMLFKSGGYLRRYKGDWQDRVSPHSKQERLFYDEKEWRAVSFEKTPKNLTFKWNDISHILIPESNETGEFLEHIKGLQFNLGIGPNVDISLKLHTYDEIISNA